MKKNIRKNNDVTGNGPKEKWIITITFSDNTKDMIDNVVQFGPIPDRDLLAITDENGETTIYILNDKIKNYKINKKPAEGKSVWLEEI